MEPLVRSAALTGYPELCRALGVSPQPVLRRAGLDPQALADQDCWIPASVVARVLELSAAASGHADFGLRLVELRRLSNLGPVSLLAREQPDLRSILRLLIRYERMYNEALHASLDETEGLATLRIALDLHEARRIRQAVELVVGAYHQILAEFLDQPRRLCRVHFAHGAPAELASHRRLFGAGLAFDAGFNGIVLPVRALERPNPGADPNLRKYAQQYVDFLGPDVEPSATRRVRKIIEVLLPTGRCTADEVARSLGMDRRTVHRQLARSGETFSSVLNDTRVELARRFVADRRRSLAEVSELLGFTSPGVFSRWFRDQFGVSPSQWRNDQAPGENAPG